MPNNWKTYKLGEIADLTMGISPKGNDVSNDMIGLPLLNGPTEFGYSYPTPKQYTRDPKKISEIGDLLFCVRGSTTGKMNFSNQQYAIGRGIGAFKGINGFSTKYVKYLIDFYLEKLLSVTTGSTFPNLSKKDLLDFNIVSCNSETANEIASILSAIDDKIENNLAINKTLEEMAMALYKHWFVDFGPFQDGEFVESELGMIPEGWEVKSVYSIANYINGAAFKPSELIDDGLFVIKISELNGGISKNTGKSFKEVKKEQIIYNGSILFSWSATLDIFLWDKGKALLNQHIFNVLPNNTLSKEVLYFLLKNIIAHFKAIAADRATTMGHIKITHLKETLISIPKKEIQTEINGIFEPLFNQILENLIENQTLIQLRDSLLPKLISGEIRLKEFKEQIEKVL